MKYRVSLLALCAAAISSCSTVDTTRSSLNERLAAARADAETNALAEGYSQFLVARYASLINDPDEAAQKYAQVVRSSPDDVSIMEQAVFSALLANDFPLALSISNKAPAGTLSETSLPRLTRATQMLISGHSGKVADQLEGRDAGMFNHLIMTSLEAWALVDLGKPGDAQIKLLSASDGDPYLDTIVLNLLGLMEVAVGEDEAALKTFQTVDESGTLIATAADSYARLLANRGQGETAVGVLDRFLKTMGHNPSISALKAEIGSGGVPPPIKRVSVREGAALSFYVPAAALAAQSQNDLPGVYYTIALRLDPDLHIARALWADALDRAGRSEESIRMLEAIPASSPFYSTARGQLAWALRRDQQNDEAYALVRTTLAANPDRDLKIQMADLLRALDRPGEALQVFNDLISADDARGEPDWRLYYARGAIHERLGYWPLAESDLKTAKALNPTSPDVLNYLGYSWVDRGLNLDAGLDLIRRALALRPQSGAITDSLGWAYYKIGRYEDAIIYLERAAELEPGLAEINDHLGDAYWMAGRKREARYQWQRAISLSDDAREKDILQRKILTGPDVPASSRAHLP
ncbi:MAG: tetratricopeptide repeat protein [Henriciella sp.]|uniref:tetratricopeptide repeat protein n=1 Tax=Henriciella sp. TaxID=1968823 RepID=UPI003C796CF0